MAHTINHLVRLYAFCYRRFAHKKGMNHFVFLFASFPIKKLTICTPLNTFFRITTIKKRCILIALNVCTEQCQRQSHTLTHSHTHTSSKQTNERTHENQTNKQRRVIRSAIAHNVRRHCHCSVVYCTQRDREKTEIK